MATNKNEKMDAIIVTLGGIYPFFRRKSKSIKTCLFFKPLEFEGFKKEAGLNAFTLSPKKWIDTTQGHNDSIHLLVFVRCHNVAYI